MPAGTYYVGDPCYAFTDRWMEWLEAAGFEDGPRYLVAEIDGYSAVGVHTAYGDGLYYGSDGHKYGVDAGMIGAVPVQIAKDNALYAMQKVTFGSAFEVEYDNENGQGIIRIGHIDIPTGDNEGEEW